MNILIFLLFFVLSTLCLSTANAEDASRGSHNSSDFNLVEQPCTLQNSQMEIIKHLKSSIEILHNFPRSTKDTRFDGGDFPSVGKIVGPDNSFGSGGFIGIKDSNGKVLRNKVVTAAHNFFNENGELYFNLEAYDFYLGNDVSRPDARFRIEKIECLDTGHDGEMIHGDFCIVTTDKPLPSHIDPATPWDQKYSSFEQAVGSTRTFYSATYHSYWPQHTNRRFINYCEDLNVFSYGSNKFIDSDCNTSNGSSGGPVFASKKLPNGNYQDVLIGINIGSHNTSKRTLIAPYLGQKKMPTKKIIVTKSNQHKYMTQIVSN